MNNTVVITSEEYGEGRFHYNSHKEAKAAFKRLVKRAKEGFKDDHITRRVTLIQKEVIINETNHSLPSPP